MPTRVESGAIGPDAIIEWTLKDGNKTLWIFSTHPKIGIVDSFQITGGNWQVAQNNHEGFVITAEEVFPDLGGAQQVVVPITLNWKNNAFALARSPKHRTWTNGELKKQAKDF